MFGRLARPASRESRLVVLCYHALSDTSTYGEFAGYGTPLKAFKRQISALKGLGFDFPDLDRVLAYLRGDIDLKRRSVLVTFDDAYVDILPGLEFLKASSIPAVVFAVTGFAGRTNEWDAAQGVPPLALMSPEEMATMSGGGIEFGVHSRTHPRLTTVDDPTLSSEIVTARSELGAMGVGHPRLFAFPHGDQDVRVRKVVQAAGYEAAFACKPATALPRQDLFAIPRLEIMSFHAGIRFEWFILKTLVGSYLAHGPLTA